MSVNLGDRMTSFLQTGSMTFLIETKLGGRLANYRETLMTAPSLSLKAIHHILMVNWETFHCKEKMQLKYALDVCIGMSYSGHSLSEVQTLQWNGSSFPRLIEDSPNDIISTQQVITFDF
jgi:hypothetical protein